MLFFGVHPVIEVEKSSKFISSGIPELRIAYFANYRFENDFLYLISCNKNRKKLFILKEWLITKPLFYSKTRKFTAIFKF
jgi:hypothetical protein